MDIMAIGNGEKVKCLHCDFEFIMSPENSKNLFTHSHKDVNFFNLWDVQVEQGEL